MAIVSMTLDPNATSYTDNDIITKINTASTNITRASCVSAAARPLGTNEVANANLAAGVAKANLDAMADTARGYIKTAPVTGQFPIISMERDATGKLKTDYDNVAI
jgi:hypothetical protein